MNEISASTLRYMRLNIYTFLEHFAFSIDIPILWLW